MMEIYNKLLSPEWTKEFTLEFLKGDYFTKLGRFINREYSEHKCYPSKEDIFRIFREISPSNARVIILGYDPYPTDNNATGLAFGIPEGKDVLPPSLKIIEAEIKEDIYPDVNWSINPTLENWVEQGIFLYNTSLTVQEGIAGSHSHMWKTFTNGVISILNMYPGKIFLLWGKHAQSFDYLIDKRMHYVLHAAHPAAEVYQRGAGFFDCKHFSKVNEIIEKNNGLEYIIKW